MVSGNNIPQTQYSFGALTSMPLNRTGMDVFDYQTRPLVPQDKNRHLSSLQESLLIKLFPDKFVSKYASKDFLEKAVKSNPRIAQLLKSQGLDVRIEPENVTEITQSHLIPTMKYAREIMDNMGDNYSLQDYYAMDQAALLHDIGKAFIPSEILNKKGKLTQKERDIIELHNDLGYEVLRCTGLSPKVLTLVKNHHDYKKTGDRDDLSQILSVADVYSALKENRAYKTSMSDNESFKILCDKSSSGEFDAAFVKALQQSQGYKVQATVA